MKLNLYDFEKIKINSAQKHEKDLNDEEINDKYEKENKEL